MRIRIGNPRRLRDLLSKHSLDARPSLCEPAGDAECLSLFGRNDLLFEGQGREEPSPGLRAAQGLG